MIIDNEIPIHDCEDLKYDQREFRTSAHEKALLLGLDILRNYN